jgi:HEPN domain-containing protein
MPQRHGDWMRQARLDLDHARLAADASHVEWAVFAAQQAAEKACKALHMSLGSDAWGHDLTALLEALPQGHRAADDLIDRAKSLDKHYIPSRYPNGFDQGTPRDHYTVREARQAIADAETILEFCAHSIAR